MKLVPWAFVALLVIALVAMWSESRRQHWHHASDSFNPLAPALSTVLRAPTPNAPVTLESDAVQRLTEEIRGLREDLRARSAPAREPLGENPLLEELRKISTLLRSQSMQSAPQSELRATSSTPTANEPLLHDLWSDLNADYEEGGQKNRTVRQHILRSEASILAEFGVPDSVSCRGDSQEVSWRYNLQENGDDTPSVAIYFIGGRVSKIYRSR